MPSGIVCGGRNRIGKGKTGSRVLSAEKKIVDGSGDPPPRFYAVWDLSASKKTFLD